MCQAYSNLAYVSVYCSLPGSPEWSRFIVAGRYPSSRLCAVGRSFDLEFVDKIVTKRQSTVLKLKFVASI